MKNDLLKRFPLFLKLGVKNRKFLQLMMKSMKIHQSMEEDFLRRLEVYVKNGEYAHTKIESNPVKYLEKNFFSILLLSIFQNLKIGERRINDYGIILHSLRGIITCTDNIIDSESKGSLFLEKLHSPILKNVMLTIVLQNMLNDTVRSLSEDSAEASKMLVGLTDAIYSIAKGENLREMGDNIEGPEEIIEGIHKKIGGELLELAFIVPIVKEDNPRLARAKEGVFEIGVALQMLDDICDFQEDAESRKKNLLFSHIAHKDNVSVEELLKTAENSEFYGSSSYQDSYSELLCDAINRALDGFEILGETGYPINREQGESIMEFMFHVRGIKDGWDIFKARKVEEELDKISNI